MKWIAPHSSDLIFARVVVLEASTLLGCGRNAGKTSLNLMMRPPFDPGFLLMGIPSPSSRRS